MPSPGRSLLNCVFGRGIGTELVALKRPRPRLEVVVGLMCLVPLLSSWAVMQGGPPVSRGWGGGCQTLRKLEELPYPLESPATATGACWLTWGDLRHSGSTEGNR